MSLTPRWGTRPLRGQVHKGNETTRADGHQRARIYQALRLWYSPNIASASQPGDEARNGPGGLGVAQRLNLAPELEAVGPALLRAADQVGHIGR
jgi:hypothetical protein